MTSVIHGEGLGKRYRRGVRVDTGLRHVLDRFVRDPLAVLRRPSYETFWALKDVSLEVKEGEVLGLIGRNGAGKTTLLKVLSRITRPTEGWAEIRGSVRSLLEVGTGFHPELTGRENTFLSGAILGMSKREIARKLRVLVAGFPITTTEPLRWLPETYRQRFLRMAATHWPALFGSQHVLKAEML
jgi:homopolymeric O-antigen transport system ATP-binding protein